MNLIQARTYYFIGYYKPGYFTINHYRLGYYITNRYNTSCCTRTYYTTSHYRPGYYTVSYYKLVCCITNRCNTGCYTRVYCATSYYRLGCCATSHYKPGYYTTICYIIGYTISAYNSASNTMELCYETISRPKSYYRIFIFKGTFSSSPLYKRYSTRTYSILLALKIIFLTLKVKVHDFILKL